MANLRTAMDSAFWDQNVSTPQTIDATARSIPGQPFPMDGSKASRALRIQQLSLLRNGFPLGIIPSISPLPHNKEKELGSFSLQSLFFQPALSNWWLGVVGQFRPKKLISSIKAEISNAEEFELPTIKDAAKHFLDKSIYSIGMFTQLALTPSSSLLLSLERHGDKNKPRRKLMFYHELPNHDITLEAAWPELYIDHDGEYWEVPESISLDMSSHVSESGLRYRFGLHKNNGHPKAVNSINGDIPPVTLNPGICAKAAFSYEKSKDFWRQKEKKEDVLVKTEEGWIYRRSYDECLKEPHVAISSIFGGFCEAWFTGKGSSLALEPFEKRSPFNADLFSSLSCSFQHGRFKNLYGDLTRLDARLDLCSASAFVQNVLSVFNRCSRNTDKGSLSSPRLNFIFQQQISGPIVFRVDSRFMLGSSPQAHGLHMEDIIYSLNYSLRLLRSGKVVAWYSPKRKEGMIELRLFEF